MSLLDSRGYCINSKCSFEIVYDYKPTLPPKNYPPASPYASLTEYLRDLIHQKIITKFIVKALLYPLFMRDIDTTEVKLRRRHKTVVRMYRHGTTSSNSSTEETSEESSSSSGHLERQNALDNYTTSGEDSHRVYSSVRYKTGKRDSWNGTVYESFIDHGEDAGEIRYEPLHDSISSFCFVTECESPTRESFMIGSTPHRFIGGDNNDYDYDNKIHLSTAKIHLLDIKQKSEQSQNSSFDQHKLSGEKWKNMAYEDLLNIDESIKPKVDAKTKSFQERHHSMPTQFVGNRFNVSSLTEIYIPSCADDTKPIDQNPNKMPTPCNSIIESEGSSHVSHSNVSQRSQQRVELTIPSTNQMTAEIALTDFNEIDEEDDEEEVPYRPIHNISEIFSNDQGNSSPIQPYPSCYDANKRCDSKFMPPATIYSSDSDSGIAAGSYTLSPSDQPFNYHRSFISHKSNLHALNVHNNATSNAISDETERVNNPRYKYFTHQDVSLEGDNRTKVVINIDGGKKKGCENVYYSGLYAHWWKKEKLPTQMIEAIAITSQTQDDQPLRGDERGSGKD